MVGIFAHATAKTYFWMVRFWCSCCSSNRRKSTIRIWFILPVKIVVSKRILHPETNAMVEKLHTSLKSILKAMLNQFNWLKHAHFVLGTSYSSKRWHSMFVCWDSVWHHAQTLGHYFLPVFRKSSTSLWLPDRIPKFVICFFFSAILLCYTLCRYFMVNTSKLSKCIPSALHCLLKI